MNKDTSAPDIQVALRLLRHERPAEPFIDDFIHDFHRRQQREAATVSTWQLCKDRISAYFHNFTMPRWAVACAAAYVAVMCTLYLNPAHKPTSDSELTAARERMAARNLVAQQNQTVITPVNFPFKVPSIGAPAMSTSGVFTPVSASGNLPPPTVGPRRTLTDPDASPSSAQPVSAQGQPVPANGDRPQLLMIK